jgi:hypothetical protein
MGTLWVPERTAWRPVSSAERVGVHCASGQYETQKAPRRIARLLVFLPNEHLSLLPATVCDMRG